MCINMRRRIQQIQHRLSSSSSRHKNRMEKLHMVLFPFMSKGHTIPLLHLARLLLLRRRNATITVITTQSNRPFISEYLAGTSAAVIALPFPQNIPGIPNGVESTDKLPTISLYDQFAEGTKQMQPHFEEVLQMLSPVTCIISDGFLAWTLSSATKFNIPRLDFFGMSNYAMSVTNDLGRHQLLAVPESDDEPISSKSFPWIKVARNDFDKPFSQRNPTGPKWDLLIEQLKASSESYGLIVNSFYKLEPNFCDFWNRECKPKAWCVGPLCLADPEPAPKPEAKSIWMQWLDKKLEQGSSVLYVAFGSQAEISPEQIQEIAKGLVESKITFLWVLKKKEKLVDESKMGERGMIVREWVNQMEILKHESVNGFLSHCGWNSVIESVCAKVPLLAWPMMADQPLNAKMVTEEINIGIRVEEDGGVKKFVKAERLKNRVKELMEGEMGKMVRKNVRELGEEAVQAMVEGGSSWNELDQLIHQLDCV